MDLPRSYEDLSTATEEPRQSYTPLVLLIALGLVWYYVSANRSNSLSSSPRNARAIELTPEERRTQRQQLSQAAAARFGTSKSSSASSSSPLSPSKEATNPKEKKPLPSRPLKKELSQQSRHEPSKDLLCKTTQGQEDVPSTALKPEPPKQERRERLSQAATARFGTSGSSSISSSSSPMKDEAKQNSEDNIPSRPLSKEPSQVVQRQPTKSNIPGTKTDRSEDMPTEFVSKDEDSCVKLDNQSTVATPQALPQIQSDDTRILGKDNITNVATLLASPTTTTKNKKKRPPPIQVLCEALSSSLFQKGGDGGGGIVFRVQAHANVGSWGGVGWWKQLGPSATTTIVTLPVYKYHRQEAQNRASSTSTATTTISTRDVETTAKAVSIDSRNVEATADAVNFEVDYAVLARILAELIPQHVRLVSIRQAASWYLTSERMVREGQLPYLVPGMEGYKEWCTLLETLQTDWLTRWTAEALHRTEPEGWDNNSNDDDKEDDHVEMTLFSDDSYDRSITSVSSTVKPASFSWQGLCDFLPETSTITSPRFLKQVARLYDDLYGHPDVSSLLFSRILTHLLFQKLSLSSKHPAATSEKEELSSILIPLSHLVPALDFPLLERTFQNDMDDGSGINSLTRISWKPLFASAAFSVGEADYDPLGIQEGQRENSLWFYQVTTQVSNFPQSVVCRLPDPNEDEKSQREQGSLFQSSRHTMSLARRIASESLLKRVLSRNKHLVFSWVEHVIQAK
jgi:hypothetical protein